MIRLLLAACSVCIVMGLAGVFWLTVFPNAPVWITAPVLAALGIGLLVTALVIFREPIGKGGAGPTVEELDAQGLLISRHYRAVRAIQVECDSDDEGPYYLVEVDSGGILLLGGSELSAYEPIEGPDEASRSRRFPCREFALRNHKTEGYLVDVQCLGDALEPALFVESMESVGLSFEVLPPNGEVIPDVTFSGLASALPANGV